MIVRGDMAFTPEDYARWQRRQEAYRRYRQSDKGRATARRYYQRHRDRLLAAMRARRMALRNHGNGPS